MVSYVSIGKKIKYLSNEEVRNKLDSLEEKYDMKSSKFYAEYNKGRSDELALEGADALRWATLWESWKG